MLSQNDSLELTTSFFEYIKNLITARRAVRIGFLERGEIQQELCWHVINSFEFLESDRSTKPNSNQLLYINSKLKMLWILKDLGLLRKGGARLGGYSLKWVRHYVKKACVQRPVTNPSIDGPIANLMSDLKEKLGFQNKRWWIESSMNGFDYTYSVPLQTNLVLCGCDSYIVWLLRAARVAITLIPLYLRIISGWAVAL
jgi:hypothetical protein